MLRIILVLAATVSACAAPASTTVWPKVMDPQQIAFWFGGYLEPLRDIPAPSTCVGLNDCERQCGDLEDPEACVGAALAYLRVPRRDKAAEILEAVCKRGHAAACHHRGTLLGRAALRAGRSREARDFLERGCQGNIPESCFNLGLLYAAYGTEVHEDRRSSAAFGRACDLAVGRACAYVGLWGHSGVDKLTYDPLARACDLGDEYGCALQIFARARTGENVADELAELCERGLSAACLKLASHVERDEDADPRELYARTCSLGIDDGCRNLARLDPEAHRESDVWREGCQRGAKVACIYRGLLEHSEPSPDRLKLLDRACLEGDAARCFEAAQTWEDPAFAKGDRSVAMDRYVRACTGGLARSCRFLGDAGAAQPGLSAAALAAVAFYRAGCALGDAASCEGADTVRARMLGDLPPAEPPPPGRRCGLGPSASGQELLQCLTGSEGYEQLSLEESWLVASGVREAAELDRRRHELTQMSENIAVAAKRVVGEDSLPQTLLSVMHALYLTRYEGDLADLRATLDHGVFNCVTSTLLYILAARRAGLLASAYGMQGHVVATIFGSGKPLFVETTSAASRVSSSLQGPQPWWRSVGRDLAEDQGALPGMRDPEVNTAAAARQQEIDGLVAAFETDEEEEFLQFDINDRSLASMLLWNRALDATEGGTGDAVEIAKGVMALGTEEMMVGLWQIQRQLVQDAVYAAVTRGEWEHAAGIAGGLVDALPDGEARLSARDLRARVYNRWFRATPDDAGRCRVLGQMERLDPDHPVVGVMRGRSAGKCGAAS